MEDNKKRGHYLKRSGNVIDEIRRNRVPGISKKILIYFSLVFFVIFLVGIGLIYELGRDRLQKEIAEDMVRQFSQSEYALPEVNEITNILRRIQDRVILGISALLLCVIASMYVFMRYFVRPIDHMGKTVYQMTRGHLDAMVSECANSEINKIGELINDLAIDLQEILLHVWSHTGQDIILMDRIVRVCGAKSGGDGIPEEIKDDLRIVRQDIEDMQNMVKAFDYYNVRFDKEKIIAEEQLK
ncbi:MAG: hypothetical protein SWH54_00580 [Thermodesulfobacteriota bacterium]|nr:hypothetical protein [Thermodesulfobacteriota bacterium]